jgi:DNA-directed RNA polymerase subunit E'/Rpb7
MSDGSQLEMVDGSLITIKPATLVLDEGEIIKHRILDLEEDEVDEEAGYCVCVCVCV